MNELRKNILLVEDEAINAMLNKLALERHGYKVVTVHSGEKAVELFKTENTIDLILMDIDLGKGIDGTQTAALILKTCNIPIIFLSSYSEPEIVEKTEKITSYGYVVKTSGITVLDTSIKMAFKLFAAKNKEQSKNTIMNESEKTVLWLMDATDEIILSVDCQGIIILLNKSGHELLGYTSPELIGRNWIDTCIPEVSRSEMYQLYESISQGEIKNSKASKYAVITKSGEKRQISWHHAIQKQKDGKVAGLISSGKDISY